MYALQWTGIRGTLAFRVIQCLQILDDNEDEFTNTSIHDGANPKQARTRKESEEAVTVKKKSNVSVLNCTQQAALDNPENVWKRSEIVQMPIEKLCPKTGVLLERYENALAAQQSVSESRKIESLYYALIGRGRRETNKENRLYMGFFWRLRGSSHVPLLIQATRSTDLHVVRLIDNPEDFWKKSEILQMPIEKLCLQTKNVLESYENAAAAQRSVRRLINLDQFYFALIGKGSCKEKRENSRLYMGFFWRLRGSSHVPLIKGTAQHRSSQA
jgi:hypothetical protein